MKGRNSHIFLAALLMLSLSSCTKPAESFSLVMSEDATDRIYTFPVHLTDTTKVYSTGIAARIDCNSELKNNKSVIYEITVKSPRGDISKELVTFPLEKADNISIYRRGGSVVDALWPYRDNIRICGSETGEWTVQIQPVGKAAGKATLGMGFHYKESDGER
ncbi:MAG: hypothetical protein KBT00_05215 [Bacteroidales bacterium]|nr:hypothetical protein [Candidatus Cacconaster merdequi]